MWEDTNQQIAIEIGERHADDLLQIEEFGGVGAGLDNTMIGFADDQQGAVGLNRAREMNLFAFAVRKIGRSERGGSERMQRQFRPLGFPRRPTPCLRGRND